ncbi:hypothetical protein NA56DRAFT_704183 [Hyaloscypha hepaticicola]|uniref:Secreted protein n=1 Tax=Hyaloscypha hepaticicola TaxID=2082293 RepID=A0A2J6Q427_9HELO|nr:hypothetical protein NA56DRAFT_704183 [Hyaloscypha hepaticicola]
MLVVHLHLLVVRLLSRQYRTRAGGRWTSKQLVIEPECLRNRVLLERNIRTCDYSTRRQFEAIAIVEHRFSGLASKSIFCPLVWEVVIASFLLASTSFYLQPRNGYAKHAFSGLIREADLKSRVAIASI